ncbi:MAG TPA: hypothetical protein ENG83_00825 [Nitrospirae bacterium]|nr:hypothetical protein BMS3Abin06_00777 [bacterium BMS3Abin06]HDH10747.1 hypothetical protein [Nitrospirota bacterium]HDZ03035.1 hypothetical protein [Nitrospirota bacterium]
MTGPLEITGIPRLILGLATGITLGILLDKGRLTKYETIVGQFLLKDFTMLKVMLSAVLAGSIGVYFLVYINAAELHITPVIPARLLIGSTIFGIGFALLGY